jgi:hypothetical protein
MNVAVAAWIRPPQPADREAPADLIVEKNR